LRNLEVYVSLFFIVVAGVVLQQSLSLQYYSDYGPGPGLLPIWSSGIMLVLAAANLVIAWKKNNTNISELLPRGTNLTNLLACVVSYALFLVIVSFVGVTIASILMLFILFSRGYKWYWGLGLSVLVAGVTVFVFGFVLGVPLPVNELGW
jgi:putative tricarboxylic transport membrane protein